MDKIQTAAEVARRNALTPAERTAEDNAGVNAVPSDSSLDPVNNLTAAERYVAAGRGSDGSIDADEVRRVNHSENTEYFSTVLSEAWMDNSILCVGFIYVERCHKK